MPTEFEFRAAARRFREAALEADALRTRVWDVGNDHGVVGGVLERTVDQAIVATALNSDLVRRECDRLAELCEQRAVVCSDYAADVAAWRAAHAAWQARRAAWYVEMETNPHARPPGWEPRRPSPPYAWVEVP